LKLFVEEELFESRKRGILMISGSFSRMQEYCYLSHIENGEKCHDREEHSDT